MEIDYLIWIKTGIDFTIITGIDPEGCDQIVLSIYDAVGATQPDNEEHDAKHVISIIIFKIS